MEEYYFFDTYAVIEIIKGNKNYAFFSEKQIITSINNLIETYYHLLREEGEKFAKEIVSKLDITLLEITEEIAFESAYFRYQNRKKKFSYIDCIGYICALKNNMKFLTGDKEFEHLNNVEFVK